MKLVRQVDKYGCGPACLAMLAGWSYAEAVKLWPTANFRKAGISRISLDRALARLGFAVCRREDTRRPFAEVHLVETQDEAQTKKKQKEWHWVLMLKDGTVLDPTCDDTQRIEDYHNVRAMAAVARICSEAP
jgi:hypothetical protein